MKKPTPGLRPLISVVIVNWNAGKELARCLETLFEHHPGQPLDVQVVDNASTDGSVRMLEERFPALRLVRNSKNVGFAAANNQAFAGLHPESAFVLLLNPDILFTGDTLGLLLNFLHGHPEIHVVTPRIDNPDGSLQRGCRRRDPRPLELLSSLLGLSRLRPASRTFAGYTYGDRPVDQTHEIEAASGSFVLFRRAVLEKAGGFDERYFLYAEDLDWCLQVRRNGFSIYYYPAARVVHERGTSSSRRPLARLWHIHYTAFQYIRKNHRSDYPALLRAAIYLALVGHLVLGFPLALAKAAAKCLRGQKKMSRLPI